MHYFFQNAGQNEALNKYKSAVRDFLGQIDDICIQRD